MGEGVWGVGVGEWVCRWVGERNRGYALLMMANKPDTALYRAPTLFLLASHGGLVHACMWGSGTCTHVQVLLNMYINIHCNLFIYCIVFFCFCFSLFIYFSYYNYYCILIYFI